MKVINRNGQIKFAQTTVVGDAASRDLSNLIPTLINASLIPATDDGYSLGSPTKRWRDGYFANNSLHIVSTAGETGTAADWNLSVLQDGYLSFSNINSNYLTITRFGNVGIGTTHPSNMLEVDGYIKSFQGYKFGDGSVMVTAAGGGSGTPGGSNGAVQFNSSGSFGGNTPNLFWDNPNDRLGIGTAVPTSKLEVNGSIASVITTRSANYTLTESDSKTLVDAILGMVTITLPLASTCSGREYSIKKIDASTNNITINTIGGNTIDGEVAIVSNSQYRAYTVTSNGTNWFII